MLMILVLHTQYDGILSVYDGSMDLHHVFQFLVESMCIIAVNVFVLISGYFGIKIKKSSVSNLVFQIYFFAIIGLIGWMALQGSVHVEPKYYIKAVFPLSHTIWFVPCYFILMLFSPFLNSYVENNSFKRVVVLTLCIYAISLWWGVVWQGTINGFDGYSWGWFLIVYLTGRIIRKFTEGHALNSKYCLLGYGVCTIIITLMAVLQSKYPYGRSFLWNYNCPLVYVSSVSLFCLFHNLKMPYNKIINKLAQSSFAVLLFHVCPFVRYKAVCKYIYESYDGICCVAMTFLCVILFYLIAAAIDQLRTFLYKKMIVRKYFNTYI